MVFLFLSTSRPSDGKKNSTPCLTSNKKKHFLQKTKRQHPRREGRPRGLPDLPRGRRRGHEPAGRRRGQAVSKKKEKEGDLGSRERKRERNGDGKSPSLRSFFLFFFPFLPPPFFSHSPGPEQQPPKTQHLPRRHARRGRGHLRRPRQPGSDARRRARCREVAAVAARWGRARGVLLPVPGDLGRESFFRCFELLSVRGAIWGVLFFLFFLELRGKKKKKRKFEKKK